MAAKAAFIGAKLASVEASLVYAGAKVASLGINDRSWIANPPGYWRATQGASPRTRDWKPAVRQFRRL